MQKLFSGIMVCFLIIFISNAVIAEEVTIHKFGDWELRITKNAFGETDAYLSHDPAPHTTMQINCKPNGKYSMNLRHPDPVGWNFNQIEVKYKIGNNSKIIKKQ